MKDEWKKIEANPTWQFTEDHELVGRYIGMEEGVGNNESNIYNFETAKGSISVWGTTLLDGRFKQIKVGDEVKIVYLGKTKSLKTGREYHNFEVYHRTPSFKKVEESKMDETVNPDDVPL